MAVSIASTIPFQFFDCRLVRIVGVFLDLDVDLGLSLKPQYL